MNLDLQKLQPYPFEKLTRLKAQVTPPSRLSHIALSIGEPKHPAPHFVQQALLDNVDKLEKYPTTKGLPELRQAIAQWLETRFHLLSVNADTQVLPVNGTREAIFAFTQAVIDRTQPRTGHQPQSVLSDIRRRSLPSRQRASFLTLLRGQWVFT